MHKSYVFFIVFAVFSQQSLAVTTAELETSRNKALAWLIQHQNGDGSWGSHVDLRVQTTSEALQVLARYGMESSFATLAGQSWLSNQAVNSTDSLSAIVKALATIDVDNTDHLNQLLANRGGALGNYNWGAYSGYERSVIDISVAMEALKQSDYNDSLAGNSLFSIHSAQHANGGWSMNQSPTQGSVLSTAKTVAMLSLYSTSYTVIDANITNGLNWLHDRQKADGGLAEDSGVTTSQVYETAQFIRAIQQAQNAGIVTALSSAFQTDLDQAREFLINTQLSSGEWQAGVLPTLAALQISPETVLADFDHDGIPDEVETILGTNPAIPDSHQFAVGNGEGIEGVTKPVDIATIQDQQSLNANLAAPQGGSGPFTWRIVSGSLPQGITLNTATGVLSGTASQIGFFNFIYQVSDANGWYEDVLARINVDPQPTTQVPFMPAWVVVIMGLGMAFIGWYIRGSNPENTKQTLRS